MNTAPVVVATHNDALVSRFTHRQLRLEQSSVRIFDPAGVSQPASPYAMPTGGTTAGGTTAGGTTGGAA